MLRLETDTWVIVADGEKVLFLRNDGGAAAPSLTVERVEQQDNPLHSDQVSDKPGRQSDGGPGQKSAMDQADWHDLAKERFAADLSDILKRMVQRDRIKKMVLIAPPKVLGEMRDQMHDTVKSRVIAEIPKTLTGHPLPELQKIVIGDLETM